MSPIMIKNFRIITKTSLLPITFLLYFRDGGSHWDVASRCVVLVRFYTRFEVLTRALCIYMCLFILPLAENQHCVSHIKTHWGISQYFSGVGLAAVWHPPGRTPRLQGTEASPGTALRSHSPGTTCRWPRRRAGREWSLAPWGDRAKGYVKSRMERPN